MMPSSSALQLHPPRRIGHAIVMAAQPNLRRQVVIFWCRADELRGAADDGVEEALALGETLNGRNLQLFKVVVELRQRLA